MDTTAQPTFGPNFVPLPYRQVSVQPYLGEFSEAAIIAHLSGRDSYRRTRYIILHQGERCAVAWVDRESEVPLFSAIRNVVVLALPDTCLWVEDPTVDTANPTALAAAARRAGATAEQTVIVRGLDAHVNFIHRPQPIPLRVVDVVPPAPAKLVRMVEQVIAYINLPAIEVREQSIDLNELAKDAPDAEAFLVPCRASGLDLHAPTHFLDERPERQPWTMLACERSCQIHRHFYGEDNAPRIDFCPRNRVPADGTPTIIKCCLLEDRIEIADQRAIVPWGAQLSHVQAALEALMHDQNPATNEKDT